jgi:hypothetical protein
MLLFSKVRASCFVISQVSNVFLDICGRLRGECIARGTSHGFCKLLSASTASTNRRGLQPIITEGCPWMGWKCPIGCLPMHSPVDIGLCICTAQAVPSSPVRRDVITYLAACANIDIAPASGPLATNV